MMAERTWVAVALACLVWFAYLKWFAPPPLSQQGTEAISKEASAAKPAAATGETSGGTAVVAKEPLRFDVATEQSTNRLQLKVCSSGGRLCSIELQKYRQNIRHDANRISLVDGGNFSQSLSTLFTDPELASLGTGAYEITPGKNRATATRRVNGYRLVKEFVWNEDSYVLQQKVRLERSNSGGEADKGYLEIPLGTKPMQVDATQPLEAWEAVAFQNDTTQRKALGSQSDGQTILQGTTGWIAFGNRYFATALVTARSPINPDVVLVKRADFEGVVARFPLRFKEGTKALEFDLPIYAGPKEIAELSQVPGLKQIIDYGRLSFLAYPLLELLRFFYRFVHNYGIAIILLTITVRLIFYPLSARGARSMKAMQKLQPQVKVLQEKYKDDRARLSQEQMALFKAHSVNPLGGCVPLLVQLPVFIALYTVLGNSIELFQAPFFLWVKDLSSRDPIYVFPVLMGIAMFLQQKMTPAVGMDPVQQKMMMFMPLIFTFFMLNLPAGLNVYMFLSTILGVLQQWAINRDGTPTSAAAVVSS